MRDQQANASADQCHSGEVGPKRGIAGKPRRDQRCDELREEEMLYAADQQKHSESAAADRDRPSWSPAGDREGTTCEHERLARAGPYAGKEGSAKRIGMCRNRAHNAIRIAAMMAAVRAPFRRSSDRPVAMKTTPVNAANTAWPGAPSGQAGARPVVNSPKTKCSTPNPMSAMAKNTVPIRMRSNVIVSADDSDCSTRYRFSPVAKSLRGQRDPLWESVAKRPRMS